MTEFDYASWLQRPNIFSKCPNVMELLCCKALRHAMKLWGKSFQALRIWHSHMVCIRDMNSAGSGVPDNQIHLQFALLCTEH